MSGLNQIFRIFTPPPPPPPPPPVVITTSLERWRLMPPRAIADLVVIATLSAFGTAVLLFVVYVTVKTLMRHSAQRRAARLSQIICAPTTAEDDDDLERRETPREAADDAEDADANAEPEKAAAPALASSPPARPRKARATKSKARRGNSEAAALERPLTRAAGKRLAKA